VPDRGAGRGPEPGPEPVDRFTVATVATGLVLLVLLQRLGIPMGEAHVSLALPIGWGVVGLLILRGRVRLDRLRAELLLAGTISVLAVTAATGVLGRLLSMPSLMLLLLIYLPWVVVARTGGAASVQRIGRVFVDLMVVLAVVGVLQLTTQLAGVWQYEDLIGEWVPPDLLVTDYNTSIPLVYASPTYKANAFVLLEPSFLSQYCALGAITAVMIGARAWKVLLLVAGLASAVSGTGIILLSVGALLVLLRAPRRIRPVYPVSLGISVALLWFSPVAPLLLDRADETTQPGTSGYMRFVQPYTEVLTGLASETSRYVVGAGAGTAERLLASDKGGIAGEAVVYTVVPKLVFEYGLLAGGLFVVFIVFTLLQRAPWRVVPAALVVFTFVLSGGLLQPATAYLAWFLSGFWSRDPAVPDGSG
jgi:hypothetical protein